MDQNQNNLQIEEEEDNNLPINAEKRIAPFVDRYFTKYYHIYQQNLPQYAFQHSNRLYMIGITHEHPIVQSNTEIQSISFLPIGVDNARTFVKGKKKKGGIKVHQNITIATVTMKDGSTFDIKGVVDGFIIEINENIINDNSYLKRFPESKGFIAILSPFGNEKKTKSTLIEPEQYKEAVKQWM